MINRLNCAVMSPADSAVLRTFTDASEPSQYCIGDAFAVQAAAKDLVSGEFKVTVEEPADTVDSLEHMQMRD